MISISKDYIPESLTLDTKNCHFELRPPNHFHASIMHILFTTWKTHEFWQGHWKNHPFLRKLAFRDIGEEQAGEIPWVRCEDAGQQDSRMNMVRNRLNQTHRIHVSGHIIIFHQPRFPSNNGISLPQLFFCCEVVWGRYNLTRCMVYLPTWMVDVYGMNIGK